MTTTTQEFGKIRSYLWPIHASEIKKFVPLLLLYALICFNYSILKAAKDALVVTAPSSGAEAIPFIKVWGILPMALLVTYLFTRLFNRYSQEKVFYIMMGGFLSFFLLFSTVLYPLSDYIHPHQLADSLQAHLPKGFSGLICLFRNWSFTLFYIASELWGTTIMTVLFWGFANEVTSVKDAKRYYAIYSVAANIATIFAGQMAIFFAGDLSFVSPIFGQDSWGRCLGLMTSAVITVGLSTIFLFRWYNQKVIRKDPSYHLHGHRYHKKSSDIKMGLRKNFSYIFKSKYLICIAIIVIGFNIAINMIEIIWKDQIKLLYPNPNDYNAYMGRVLMTIGIISTFIGLFFTGNLIRKLGWTFSAMLTPVMLLVTGAIFFGFLLLNQDSLNWITSLIGMTPVALGVLFGTLNNAFSRSCKYTFFDITKEISFIPLSTECKLKGKAAIDGVGSRLGKSGGSVIHQFLLMIFGTISLSTPFVGLFLLLITSGWIVAVRVLGKQFNALTAQNEKLEIEEESEEEKKEPATLVNESKKQEALV